MKIFLKKGLIFGLPVLFIILLYIVLDPGKKIWSYNVYAFNIQMLNKGSICTNLLLKNKDKYHYDSFIFGSSRSCATRSETWKKYLSADNSPFSYGSWHEELYGILRKIQFLDSLHVPIKNALLIIDVDNTFVSIPGMDPIQSDHYLLSGKSRFDYYKTDFRDWMRHPLIFVSSIDYAIFHKRRHYMKDFVDPQYGGLNSITGDWRTRSDSLIDADSVNYYRECLHLFYKRSVRQQYASVLIHDELKSELLKIQAIFKKHKTNYKFVISPLYDQIKLNPADLALLNAIFGTNTIYDFSGINAITNNIHNYGHDVVHYRIRTGDLLLKTIYAGEISGLLTTKPNVNSPYNIYDQKK